MFEYAPGVGQTPRPNRSLTGHSQGRAFPHSTPAPGYPPPRCGGLCHACFRATGMNGSAFPCADQPHERQRTPAGAGSCPPNHPVLLASAGHSSTGRQMKQCSRCKESKPLDHFQKDSSRSDGFQRRCRDCQNAASRAWREANRDKARASSASWAACNRERIQEWRDANPDRLRDLSIRSQRVRAERFRQTEVLVISPKDRRRLANSPCIGCGATHGIESDHLIPVSRGGRTSIGNLAPMCRRCNASKRTRFLFEWRVWRAAVSA